MKRIILNKKKRLKKHDKKTIIMPYKDLSFLLVNFRLATMLLQNYGMEFTEKELKEYERLYEKYVPTVYYYNTLGYYDKKWIEKKEVIKNE